MYATCTSHLITLMISGEAYKLWTPSLCSLNLASKYSPQHPQRMYFTSFTQIQINTKYYSFLYFNVYNFTEGTGRQNTLNRTVASIHEFNLLLISSWTQFWVAQTNVAPLHCPISLYEQEMSFTVIGYRLDDQHIQHQPRSLSGVERPKRKANLSLPHRTKVRNVRRFTLTSPRLLHGVMGLINPKQTNRLKKGSILDIPDFFTLTC